MQLWAMLLRYHENDIESILTRAYDGSPITEILNYISRSYQTATLHETAEHFMRMFKKNLRDDSRRIPEIIPLKNYFPNISFIIFVTAAGSAFPFSARMLCPMSAPKAFCLPPL